MTIHRYAAAGNVSLTLKARREMAELQLGLDSKDVPGILLSLTSAVSAGRQLSRVTEGWMYLFNVEVNRMQIYLKVVLRSGCVVISFHESRGGDRGEAD
jgi:hypothetical protein